MGITRVVDPHSFLADPNAEPTVFLNADPDPARLFKKAIYQTMV